MKTIAVFPHLFREHHKEYEDGESLQADEDGVDVGHKEEVSVEDQDANDPRDAHDNRKPQFSYVYPLYCYMHYCSL